ncbi:hypothetical protein BDV27DRAFT_138873 [Aspergillus caelatus]|uniref:Secreted protein n=1 Tax=Aspergillus caelatus TaxID=61420 RepID=A0A5N6ZLN4_9EURO|nr:uncharacterized protein BDV27DRAFT_138873 [Aspergillus caelatus]KAE8357709.1 hypothetical protein BDV27DRAFT_138873 [Aspergillus caelatus]
MIFLFSITFHSIIYGMQLAGSSSFCSSSSHSESWSSLGFPASTWHASARLFWVEYPGEGLSPHRGSGVQLKYPGVGAYCESWSDASSL